jgi:DNA adenine methylase
MGSKRRIAKHLLPIMLEKRLESQCWVEPFVGGANMIDKVNGQRIGNDNNKYLIALFKAIQSGWIPPDACSEEEYKEIRNNKEFYPEHLVGFIGHVCSFGGRFFNGYARNKEKYDYCLFAKKTILKQKESIDSVEFYCRDYKDLVIPAKSLIYCDPPYKGTEKYATSKSFNHEEFWQWCRDKVKENHTVFISEYNAPDDFECVKEIEITVNFDARVEAKKKIEKLFTIKGAVEK